MHPEDYEQWLVETPDLARYTNELLPKLQRDVANEIIRLGFMRNMSYFWFLDYKILREASEHGIGALNKNKFEYLLSARKYYTPAQMKDLGNALEPERFQKQQVINLSFGAQQNVYEIREGDQVIEAGLLTDGEAAGG